MEKNNNVLYHCKIDPNTSQKTEVIINRQGLCESSEYL